jgi:hypothetical protein
MIDPDVRREIDALKSGTTYTGGTFTLDAAPATSTVVTRNGVSSSSIIHAQGYSALAVNSDITRIVPTKGSFTVYHSSSANTRTYRYSSVTPQS